MPLKKRKPQPLPKRLRLRSAMPPTVSTAIKKEAKPAKFAEAVFHSAHEAAVKEALRVAEAQVYGQSLCRDLGNAAPNECTPEFLARTEEEKGQIMDVNGELLDVESILESEDI